jgi:small basic protein
MWWYLLAGLLAGVLVGLNLPWKVPAILARYMAVGILAGVDTSLGGLRASLEGEFDIVIFATGFFGNVLLSAGFVYVGDMLGIELYLAAVVALGARVFNNMGRIRRLLLRDAVESRKQGASETGEKGK